VSERIVALIAIDIGALGARSRAVHAGINIRCVGDAKIAALIAHSEWMRMERGRGEVEGKGGGATGGLWRRFIVSIRHR